MSESHRGGESGRFSQSLNIVKFNFLFCEHPLDLILGLLSDPIVELLLDLRVRLLLDPIVGLLLEPIGGLLLDPIVGLC
jgi:hypothetical protein